MPRAINKRFMIAILEYLAAQISAICKADRLNHSDFFCEAAQAYLAAKSSEPQYAMPIGKDDLVDNPFHGFSECGSKSDSVYDTLR